MNPRNLLDNDLRDVSDNIRNILNKNSRILVLSNQTADGIAAGSIMLKTFQRLDAKCMLRTSRSLADSNYVGSALSNSEDFLVLIDFESEPLEKLEKNFHNRWLLIRHQSQANYSHEDVNFDHKILSTAKYGIDGRSEISSGGICYLLSTKFDNKNVDLSVIAVLSSLGEKQDKGKSKSLIGINAEIAKVAESIGLLLSHPEDLIVVGREGRPIHEAIALTPFPYVDGLTWNPQRAKSIAQNSGVKLKEKGRWRVFAELSDQEKWSIYDSIARFGATNAGSQALLMEESRGMNFTLLEEDQQTLLRDAREYSDLIGICCRMMKSGLAIAVCMGDRFRLLAKAEEIVSRYQDIQRQSLSCIFGEKWRIWEDSRLVFINGEGVVTEYNLEDIISLVESSPQYNHKIVVGRTVTQAGKYKICCRVRNMAEYPLQLGTSIRNCFDSSDVTTQLYDPFVSCREIQPSELERFISCLKSAVVTDGNAAISYR
jgi:single-stranded-DNA-specific exonuclease